MLKAQKKTFFILLLVILATAYLAIFGIGDSLKGATKMRLGIDIRGGVEAIFEPEDKNYKIEAHELEAARNVIETRLDAKNILEREVTVDQKAGQIIVRFPWKSDETEFNPEAAIMELGEMAKLTFRDSKGNVVLEGKDVERSGVIKHPQRAEYVVQIIFNEKGKKDFAKATKELLNQQMGIYMDEQMVSNPYVKEVINGGEATIDGMAGYNEAKLLSEKINAGALPFSMVTSNHSTISPTLGGEALNIMILAGAVAFVGICLFMISYYKLPGIISCFCLVFQLALQLLALSLPQFTLTLPGIAGVILSLGMAVDANVIITERIGEEIRSGSSIRIAIQRGYSKALSSVLDGNITSAIVAILLMVLGSGSMLSFGYTLLTGLVINVLSSICLDQQLLTSIIQFKALYKERWFRVKKEKKTIKFYQKKFIAFSFSCILIIIGVVASFMNGIQLDIQFAGGAVLKYNFTGEINQTAISENVSKALGRSVNTQITTHTVTKEQKLVLTLAGNEGLAPEEQQKMLQTMNEVEPQANFELSESYVVEPYIGSKTLSRALLAIGLSMACIVIYVWIRFAILSGLLAGSMALVALLHDIGVVLLVFILFKIPLNDSYVAVTLTIIGYSINDTIVLYDRIRENKKSQSRVGLEELMNRSITQTLGRSINTSLTTIFCVISILVFAIVYDINSIKVFALPLLFGLISGCYSSVCIAGPLWVACEKLKKSVT